MEYVEARLILISVHATPAGPPRNLRASRPTLEREVAASGVGDEGGGESKERIRGRMRGKREREREEDSKRESEKERGKEHKRTRLTGDRRKSAEEGERWDSLAALSTGGGRGPRGWHSVTFNPRPPSAAPHSNNRHCRFEGWMRGEEDVGGSWVDGSGRLGEAGRQRVSFVRPKHTSIDWTCPRVEEVSPSPLFLPWPSSSSPMVLSSFVVLPLSLDSLTKAPNASGARIHVYVTLCARICGMARGCYGDPPSARG